MSADSPEEPPAAKVVSMLSAAGWRACAAIAVLIALAVQAGAWLHGAAAPLLPWFALVAGGLGALLLRRLSRVPHAHPAGGCADAGLLELLYQDSPLAIARCRQDGGFAEANPAFLALTGYAWEELRRLDYGAIAPRDRHDAPRDSGGWGGRFGPYDTELRNRDGMAVPVRVFGARGAGPDGAPLQWIVAEDLSARRRMAEALKHSESEARMLTAVASDTCSMVLICDRAGRIEWVNRAFEAQTGYTRREVVGKSPGALLQGPDTDRAAAAHMRERMATGEGFTLEMLNYAKDGRAYWVEIECAPVFDHGGAVERYVAIERDITRSRDMHQALARSEERFRDLTELSSDFFWETDAELRFTEITETGSAPHLTALRLGTVPWDNPLSLLAPEKWAEHKLFLQSHQAFADFENPVLSHDGRVLWRSISGRPQFDAEGRFTGYRGVGRDITARKEAADLLNESKRMYRRVVEGVRDIIFQIDTQGAFVFLNRAWAETTGHSVEEVIGTPIHDYVHPEDRHAAASITDAASPGAGGLVESVCRIRCRDGEYRWFEMRVQPAAGEAGVTIGTLHDVTRERAARAERRLAESALREAQERYQRALDGANDGMWERDLRDGRVFFSPRFKELLGFAEPDFPDDRHFLYQRIHADDWGVFRRGLDRMHARRERAVIDCRIRCANDEHRWFRFRSTVVCDAAGEPMLTSGTLSDIHEARLAEDELKKHRDGLAGLVEERTASAVAARVEAEQAREAAEAANRTKSEFLANMSHELRTPMHAILSFAAFGVDKAAHAERGKLLHYFGHIQKSGSRLLVLLNDLLDLSKLEAGKMEMQRVPTDPAALLREAITEAEALARQRHIWLELRAPETPLSAQLDGARLLQVAGNLLSNAIKFSPPGGRVLVSLESRVAGPGVPPWLEIGVRDEGVGIPEDELESVFDKFVQSSKTKTGAGGTGLGLAICREIVLAHGGTIEARNNPPPAPGACFVVRLPCV